MDGDEARELLKRERARIEGALGGVAPNDERVTDDFDPTDGGAELTEAGVDEALAEQLQAELEAVEGAERRLAEGSYGISVDSGEPIPDARLRTIPWAERTADEQARLDAASEA
jgi:DnaK suppressor protein